MVGAGLSDRQAKAVILQALHEQYIDPIPVPEDRYWAESPHKAQITYMLSLMDAYDQVRFALRDQFGDRSVSDPVFKRVFQPLALQSPYLSSEEQVALQRFQAEQQLQMLSRSLLNPEALVQGDPGSWRPASKPAQPAEPSHLLSDTSWREHRLRASFLANQMRNSGVVFTETSFR